MSVIKIASDSKFQIVLSLFVCLYMVYASATAGINEPLNRILSMTLLFCQPAYIVIANKYCLWIRSLVVILLILGISLKIYVALTSNFPFDPMILYFVVVFVFPLPTLILTSIGLRISFKKNAKESKK